MKKEKIKKKLPVGIENFEKIRTENFYYVDKTAMIRNLLQKWGEVNLFTRPRRFGKSLNMSMLKAFFEIGCNKTVFEGLEISGEKELCCQYMGKFPVISISLKGIEANDYKNARSLMVKVINKEMRRLQYLFESERLTSEDKKVVSALLDKDMDDGTLFCSLYELSELLHKHYEKKVIILIDEYDVPLAKAEKGGYYQQMLILLRNLFDQALKTNEYLYFAVMTGCLRIAKESIFTGLNNLKIFSAMTVRFDEYFGFTDGEIRKMLAYYDLENQYEVIKNWYDGYRFGNEDVYCPWDVINYCDEFIDDPMIEPKDYWSNTRSNDVVRRFVRTIVSILAKREAEALIAGETIEKEIHEELTYSNLYDSIENIWSVLLMTGYLTQRQKPSGKRVQLAIPNMEIRNIFIEQIMAMFREETGRDGETLNKFCNALRDANAEEVERLFSAYLDKTISIRDTFVRKSLKENFYHGILLGILGFKHDWFVKSNKESGNGYSDILIKIEDEGIGMIIEVKYAEDENYTPVCEGALKQIVSENYLAELRKEGYRNILKYGIACYKKRCKVMVEKD